MALSNIGLFRFTMQNRYFEYYNTTFGLHSMPMSNVQLSAESIPLFHAIFVYINHRDILAHSQIRIFKNTSILIKIRMLILIQYFNILFHFYIIIFFLILFEKNFYLSNYHSHSFHCQSYHSF